MALSADSSTRPPGTLTEETEPPCCCCCFSCRCSVGRRHDAGREIVAAAAAAAADQQQRRPLPLPPSDRLLLLLLCSAVPLSVRCSFLDLLCSFSPVRRRQQYVERLVGCIAAGRGVSTAMQLLEKIILTYHSTDDRRWFTRRDSSSGLTPAAVIEAVEAKYGIVRLCIREIVAHHRRYRETIKQEMPDIVMPQRAAAAAPHRLAAPSPAPADCSRCACCLLLRAWTCRLPLCSATSRAARCGSLSWCRCCPTRRCS